MSDQPDKRAMDVRKTVDAMMGHILGKDGSNHFDEVVTDEHPKWVEMRDVFKEVTGLDINDLPPKYKRHLPHLLLHIVDSVHPLIAAMYQREMIEMTMASLLMGIELEKLPEPE